MNPLKVLSLIVLLLGTSYGEHMQWHKVTLDFQGPATSETATPNPFLDYRLDVTFTQGETQLVVPGYYAADGKAEDTSADSGSVWRVHFSPPTTGEWTWEASFRKGENVSVADDPMSGEPAGFFNGKEGTLNISASDKTAPDTRALGRLEYVGTRYPVTKGNGKIFLKQGPDAPENLLAYRDFDGDFKTDGQKDQFIKTWEPHLIDWQEGDPTWGTDKGKGLIGAINYLASKGLNSISFLTMNIQGDDRNVFPYLNYQERLRMDVSTLAQWEEIFSHATSKGFFLHFKTQETENETILDNGDTGLQRKLYYRELIARFAHHPALNWNMGEENGKWGKHNKEKYQSTEQRLAMARYIEAHDPYNHPIVIHNGQWPHDLYGEDTPYDGASLQTGKEDFRNVHSSTKKILENSASKGKPWMVACDEPGDAQRALVPDSEDPSHDNARQNALWGNLLAGGWGCEWYFGYSLPHSDLTCQDFRSRDKFWDQCCIALEFFRSQDLLLNEMANQNSLLKGGDGFCLAHPSGTALLLIKNPEQEPSFDLGDNTGTYSIKWFNPRKGGALLDGSVTRIDGSAVHSLGLPPHESDQDWVCLIKPMP